MKGPTKLPKTAATALLVALGAALPYLAPGLERYRLVSSADLARAAGAFRGEPRAPLVRRNEAAAAALPPFSAPSPATAPFPGGIPARPARHLPSPHVGIEDPSGELGRFFARVALVEAGEPRALARITHFGDSPLTGDLISGEVREMLQAELGDGGPGFVLPARPWAWYGHDGIGIEAAGWTPRSPLFSPGDAGTRGLGLVSFTSARAGVRSEIRREGGSFTRAEVMFTASPAGGTLLVSLDGGPEEGVPTAAPECRTERFVASRPEGARRIALRPKGDGDVTVHGVVLERDGPGVVYDSIGANGASVHALNRLDERGWMESLALRGSDLVILNYGTNESAMEGIGGPRYEREYATTISRVRKALPGASILVMAPMDRGVRLADGTVGTLPAIRRLVAAQRRVARKNGCAFYDTFTAMGGEGTMGRWYENDPRLVTADFTHTTKPGSDRVARLFVGALLSARSAWEARDAARPGPAGEVEPPVRQRPGGARPPS